MWIAIRTYLLLQLHNLSELLITLDQGVNVLLCILTGSRGYSDETLSAHCWRSCRDGRIFARLLMPPIDWLFSWQPQTQVFLDEAGVPITGHCHRAYEKERERDYLPPEYRLPDPAAA